MNDVDLIARSKARELNAEAQQIADTDNQFRRLLAMLESGGPLVGDRLAPRRGHWIRTVTMVAAAAAVIVAITVGLLHRGDRPPAIVPTTVGSDPSPSASGVPDTSPVSTPSTVPTPAVSAVTVASIPSTSTTDAIETSDTSVALSNSALHDWLTTKLAAGLTETMIETGNATTARAVIASDGFGTSEAVVVLGDGRIAPVPPEVTNLYGTLVGLSALGDRIALFQRVDMHIVGWILDPIALTWTPAPELGLGEIPNQSTPYLSNIAGSIVITESIWTGQSPNADQQTGAVLSPDLHVTAVAQPPEDVIMYWNLVSGTKGLLIGQDTSATNQTPVRQPWTYDVVTNRWTAVPNPSWVDCGPANDQCEWSIPHELGDEYLAAATSQGVVASVPGGSIGLLDVDAGTWRRLDDAPISLGSAPAVTVENDHGGTSLVVFVQPGFGPPDTLGAVTTLDITTGSWTTKELDISPSAPRWDIRTTDGVVLIGTADERDNRLVSPLYAVDRATGTWRDVTPSDEAAWRRLHIGRVKTQGALAEASA
jgi:hypothetical protein